MSRRCLTCEAKMPEEAPYRPFCSARCKDVDLGKWFGEEFVISRPMRVDEVQRAFDPETGESFEIKR